MAFIMISNQKYKSIQSFWNGWSLIDSERISSDFGTILLELL